MRNGAKRDSHPLIEEVGRASLPLLVSWLAIITVGERKMKNIWCGEYLTISYRNT
jgi:hypothetical protein